MIWLTTLIKQLWSHIGGLRTPERRLLFSIMLAAIVVLSYVLGTSTSDSKKEMKQRIQFLENESAKKDTAKETLRILMQDKIDQCADEKFQTLKESFELTEQLKQTVKNKKSE